MPERASRRMRHRLREPLIRHDAAPQTQRRAADSLRRRRFVDHPGRAHNLGATDVIDSSKGDFQQVRHCRPATRTHGRSGCPSWSARRLNPSPSATATIVGVPPDGSELSFPFSAIRPECKVQTSRMGSNQFHLEFYRQGRLNLDDMVSRRGRLEDINESLPGHEGGRGGAHRFDLRRRVLTCGSVWFRTTFPYPQPKAEKHAPT